MHFKSIAHPIQRGSKDQARRDFTVSRIFSAKSKNTAAFVLVLWSVAGALWAGTAGAPATQLQELGKYAAAATEALQSGDVRAAKQHFQDFDQGWDRIEDGVRETAKPKAA